MSSERATEAVLPHLRCSWLFGFDPGVARYALHPWLPYATPSALSRYFIHLSEILVMCNEIGNDVHADVLLDSEFRMLYPIEIAARRIEKCSRTNFLEQRRQFTPQLRGARKVRTWTSD